MKEAHVLILAAGALLLGMFLGCVTRSKPTARHSPDLLLAPDEPANATASAVSSRPATAAAPDEAPNADSAPEAVYRWRRKDKEAIQARLDSLPKDDLEYLCFTLDLIPRDEVFDKVNIRGRLRRFVDQFRQPADFDDLEKAFQRLETDRNRTTSNPGE